MPSPLKLASAWRIVKDVDLEGIRRRSNERFELWAIANDGADTREIASLLAPGPEHHPWLLRFTPDQVPTPGEVRPLAAVIVTRTADLDAALAGVRNALRRTFQNPRVPAALGIFFESLTGLMFSRKVTASAACHIGAKW